MSMSKGEFSLYSYPSPPKKTFISKTLRKDTYTIFPLIDPNDRNKPKKKKKNSTYRQTPSSVLSQSLVPIFFFAHYVFTPS